MTEESQPKTRYVLEPTASQLYMWQGSQAESYFSKSQPDKEIRLILTHRASSNREYAPLDEMNLISRVARGICGVTVPFKTTKNENWSRLPDLDTDEAVVWLNFLIQYDTLRRGQHREKRLTAAVEGFPCGRAITYLREQGYSLAWLVPIFRWLGHPRRHLLRHEPERFCFQLRDVATVLCRQRHDDEDLRASVELITTLALSKAVEAKKEFARDLLTMVASRWQNEIQARTMVLASLIGVLACEWLSNTIHPEMFAGEVFLRYHTARQAYEQT